MPEFRVNTTTTNDQTMFPAGVPIPAAQAIATDDSGNFVVVWASRAQDDTSGIRPWGVYAQRFDATGNKIGVTEFRVNTFTTDEQWQPSVAMDADGDFVVTWTSFGQPGDPDEGVYIQRYSKTGNPIDGEFQVNTTLPGTQQASNVAMDANGSFVVTWTSLAQDGNGNGIIARRYDNTNNTWGSEFRVNTQITSGDQQYSRIAMADNGNFVITWINGSGAAADVYARLFDADGDPITTEFRVNNYTTNGQLDPSVAMDADGDFVIVWASNGQDGSNDGVYARRYNALGQPQGTDEFRVNSTTFNQQRNPTVSMDGAGNFIVTWSSAGQDAGTGWGVFGQRFNASGNRQGSEFRINDEIAGDQQYSSVSMTPTGNYVVAWTSSSGTQDGGGAGVYAEAFAAAANQIPTISTFGKTLDEDQVFPFTLADFVGAFTDPDGDSLGSIQILALPTQGTLKLDGVDVLLNQEILASNLANLTYTPASNFSGSDSFTWNGSDGTSFANTPAQVSLTINPVNDPPIVSAIDTQITNEDAPIDVAFTVSDVDTPATSLTVVASSSDTTLVPNANIEVLGTGINRTVRITPTANLSGSTTITLDVTDGDLTTTRNFLLTVTAIDDPPTITAIADQSINEDANTGPLSFTIGDVDTDINTLTLSGTSSNPALVPNGNIVISGTGANRTVTVTPVANQSGTATITLTVSDGTTPVTETFDVVVAPLNDLPTITAIADQSIEENTSTPALAFTVGDAETPPNALTVTATSNNTALVPNANILIGGSGANRTVTVTPLAGQSGVALITVSVNDGTTTTTETFNVSVGNVDDPPTITAIADQNINEDANTGALAFTIGDIDTPIANLTVTATSSNTTLIPNANVVLGGSGANRTITVAPAANLSGSATITINVSDGTTTATETFNVVVTAVNDNPTITAIADQNINEDANTGALAFTIGDEETLADDLTVTATSSNTTLVPNANVVVTGAGANRTITVTPVANLSGTTTITLSISDGTNTTIETFDVVVNPLNDPPTVSAIDNQTTSENTPTTAIPFTVGDVETAPGALTITATSSDTTLVPNGNIVIGGSGANRTITVSPAAGQSGIATITVNVSDGTTTTTETFSVSVGVVDDPPTISEITNQTTDEDSATTAIPFTIGDPDTPIGSLVITAVSDDQTLIPNGNIVVGGTGTNRTITVTPASNLSGTATITVNVSDGTTTATETFNVVVTPVDDLPTISAIADQPVNEDTPTTAIPFTIDDVETPVGSLTLTATSSNPTLVPNGNIVITGTGANRTIRVTPALNQFGTATITLSLSDGANTTTETFDVVVAAVNDSPTVSAIADQTTNEGTATTAIPFTVGDVETPSGSLIITATSSDGAIVPNGNIVIGGSGANRTVTVTPLPNQSGNVTISVNVSDGNTTTTETFNLAVGAVDDPPTISAIADQSINEDTPTAALPFTIGDVDTPVGSLTVTAASSNTTLVPNANVVLTGTGSNRAVTVTPVANQSGTTTINLTVSDGNTTTTETFDVVVGAVNDPPTISAIADQTIDEDQTTTALPFTIGDIETTADLLTVTATSSDTTLVPNGNIVIGGTGANRTVTVTPAANQSGTATITIAVNDGTTTSFETFNLVVGTVNDAPFITAIGDQTVNEGISTGAIAFTVSDAETSPGVLTVTATSSNPALVPNSNIILGGSGSDRTVTVNPVANQFGTAIITVSVSDGTATTVETFNVVVGAINDPPTITAIADQTINEDQATTALPFTIADVDNPVNTLTVTATSANPALVPDSNIVISGTGANRTVTVTPLANQSGTATITINVSDGTTTTTETFDVVVNGVNDPPTISAIADQTTNEDTPTAAIPFTLDDIDTSPLGLIVTATSSNPTLVPNGNLTIGGTGTNRTIIVNPAANQTGTATITVNVNDGTTTVTETFDIVVNPVNDPPTITAIADQSVNEGVTTGALAFTVNDAETPAGSLTITATSNNPTLVPNSNIILGGSGANRTVTVNPAANQFGTATITVSVSDGTLTTTETFDVVVGAVNDPPTISTINNQLTNEDTPTTAIPFTVGDIDTPLSNLTITATSSNGALVPDGNVVITGTGANRTVVVTPTANQSGTTTITLTVSDGNQTATETFDVTVNPINDAPIASAIADQNTSENTATAPIPFTISDIDSPLGTLVVTATSGNTALIPNSNIIISGTGANRTVTVTPATNQSGTATISVRVSDGTNFSTETFDVVVTSVNDPPTIAPISDRVINEDTSTGAIPLTLADIDTSLNSLTVTATSSNPALIPNGNIVILGAGANRSINVTPLANQTGIATITVNVNDGTTTVTETFDVTVNPVNDPPTVSVIADQTTTEGTATTPIAFTVGDAESLPDSLVITATSGNTTLVPTGNIAIGGTGANRTVTVTPVANQSGTAVITLQVSDGTAITTRVFNLVVGAVNDAPTITAIANQTINEDTASTAIPFTIGDVDTPVGSLTVTATSSNPTLIPNGSIVIGGTGANRTVTVTPATNQNGTSTITLTVNDGNSTTTETFDVVVTPIADPPTVNPVNKAGTENTNVIFATTDFAAGFADPDGDTLNQLRITSLPTNGTLRLSGAAVTVNQVIPVAQIADLTYTPNPQFNGTDSFGWTGSDGTSFAATASTVTLAIAAVNDAPTLTNVSKVINEDTVINFSSNDFIGAFSDLDGNSLVKIQITSLPTNGTLRLGGSLVTINQEIAVAQLNSLTFTPNTNFGGTISFGWNGSDGTLYAATAATVNITVNAIDDPPVVTTTATPIPYAEGASAIPIDSGLTLSDTDSTQLNGATVTIVNFDPAQDVLNFTPQAGITGSLSGGTLTFSGTANLNDYIAVLRSVTYRNSSSTPNLADRLVRFSVRDTSNVTSNFATRTIQVLPDDTAPLVTTTGSPLAYPENGGAVLIDTGVTIGDSDSVLLTGATVTIVGYTPGSQELLGFNPQNGITGTFDSATGVLTLSGLSALPNYQNALRSITYTNNSDNPPTSRAIQFAVRDNTSSGNLASRQIQIAPVNDAPSITTSLGVIPYDRTKGAIALDVGMAVVDPDTTTLTSAAIAIVGYTPGQGNLGFTNQNGITGSFNANTGVLTLTGVASANAYQTALRTITYNNPNATVNTPSQLIQFSVSDGSLSSNPTIGALQIVFENTPPTVDLNGASAGIDLTMSATPGAVARVADGITLSDVDSATLSSALVFIENPIRLLQEQLAVDTTGTGIIASYNPDVGVLNLLGSASVATYQQVLRSVTYRSSVLDPEATPRRIRFSVHDGEDDSATATTTLSFAIGGLPGGGPGLSLVTTPNRDVIDAPTTDDAVSSVLANLQQSDTISGGIGLDAFILTDGTGTAIVDARSTTNQVTGIISNGTTVTNFERFDFSGFGGTATMMGSDLQNDSLIGGLGNDSLMGGGGNDSLTGNAGNDILDGGLGTDSLIGNGGNDLYVVDSLTDSIVEGLNAGTDTVRSSVTMTLGTNVENLLLTGTALNGTGNALNNSITGNGLNNVLVGDVGNDTLLGDAGRDRITGGVGNDRITGGAGGDRLTGGAGRDGFQFNNRREGGDLITDFNAPQDTIYIARSGFNRRLRRGRVRADQFVLGSGAADTSDRFIYNSATGSLFYDADGLGGTRQVQIARLTNRASLTNADIVLL
ncbi:tandem-95 repeat protein [Oscillatoria sp. FACHB-1407]|uniref:tandem-95 repeat protein n=1 Tax=Oscillatoria sp. FACHB-1407 TaxID=2692847 RepID=UPI001687C78F|nr:tandem-95 repeat protein [Oscillatoria sp. FACHB-1407]MBD2461517.1 tandem-95 repeat protein [Oscillatoria sp. FACHB-1407]